MALAQQFTLLFWFEVIRLRGTQEVPKDLYEVCWLLHVGVVAHPFHDFQPAVGKGLVSLEGMGEWDDPVLLAPNDECGFAIGACLLAAGMSWLRGGKYHYSEDAEPTREITQVALEVAQAHARAEARRWRH